MTFDVGGEAYGRFMGRYSEPLAVLFADWAKVRRGDRVLDVGCGPGALTAVLVERLGAHSVSAVDPSAPFLESIRARLPEVDVWAASAESLPYSDDSFDKALAQPVVHFMADPVAGLSEMRRVTRPGGRVAACVWDLAGTGGPISLFWQAAQELNPLAAGEANLPGVREGDLLAYSRAAGLTDVEGTMLTVTVGHESFDEWWQPYTLGVGPAGDYVKGLDAASQEELRERCRRLLPPAPFQIAASAWAVRAAA